MPSAVEPEITSYSHSLVGPLMSRKPWPNVTTSKPSPWSWIASWVEIHGSMVISSIQNRLPSPSMRRRYDVVIDTPHGRLPPLNYSARTRGSGHKRGGVVIPLPRDNDEPVDERAHIVVFANRMLRVAPDFTESPGFTVSPIIQNASQPLSWACRFSSLCESVTARRASCRSPLPAPPIAAPVGWISIPVETVACTSICHAHP